MSRDVGAGAARAANAAEAKEASATYDEESGLIPGVEYPVNFVMPRRTVRVYRARLFRVERPHPRLGLSEADLNAFALYEEDDA